VAEENLGTAVLRIVVNDDEARSALNLLRRDVQSTTQQATRARRTTARPPTPKGGARESTDAVERANQRIIGIQNRINLLEAKGVDITQARARLSQAIAANQQSNFGSVRQITSQLSNTLKIEEGRLRVSAAQTAQLKRQEAATKSVTSTERTRAQKPTGVGFATTPEQILAGRGGTQKGAATGINTLESTLTKAVQLRNRLNVLDAKGVDVSKLRATYEQANAAATQNQFGTSQRLLQNLARQVSLSENDLRVTKLREAAEKRRIKAATTATSAAGAPKPQGPFSPVGGLKTIPDSPAGIREQKRIDAAKAREAKAAERAAIAEERRAQQILEGITAGQPTRRITGPGAGTRKRFGDALSSGLIGGGFPLLFGQGPGAAAGGLVGGLGGGALGGGFGFGASIVGTILGSVVDEALNKGKALAAAFDDPIGKFSELQQAALLSSSAVEKNISALIEQGRNAEAAALIQLDIAQRFGDTGELDNLRSAYDDLGRAFSQLSVITAKYVAGPLSDFISKLASSFQAFSSKDLFNERVAGASPDVQTEARARVRSAAAELSGSGLSLAEVANKAYQEGLNLLDERLGKTREIQAAEQALALAKQRQNELDSLTTDQIKAQVQGYDLLNLRLEKQRIETQKLQDLQAAPPDKAEGINRKALQDTVRIDADINKLLQDRAAQRGLDEAQDKIKLQSIGRQIAATQALGKAERGVARDTLATVQGIQAGIAAARDREREIGAQIDAARLRGGDAGEQEASRLVSQQQIAAQETRLELERGALALKEAGEKLRDDLRNAVLDFTRVRSDAQGLNKFLNPQQQQQRAEQDFRLLLPQFREAQARFTQLTGARAPEFTGPTASVNESIRDFIQRTQTESQATKNLVGTQQALATNLEAYNNTVAQLAAVTQTLADKNWAVNVAVSGGQAAISGDVLNGAISP
jgi:hypothetical protein